MKQEKKNAKAESETQTPEKFIDLRELRGGDVRERTKVVCREGASGMSLSLMAS